jgi:phage-related baseplate assembly protein
MTEVVAAPVAIDLSRLPAPAVITGLSYEDELAAVTADFRARWPEYDAFIESDPAVKLLEVFAYRLFTAKAGLNERAAAVLLPYSTGTDLDNLVAFYGIQRLVIRPATETTEAVLESDADLRARALLSLELLSVGMTAGGYRFKVLTAAPSIKDVAVLKRAGGYIDLVLLGRDGDGTVPDETVDAIATLFADDAEVQLTDIVGVRAARIVPYTVDAIVECRNGPDPAVIKAAVEAKIRAYAIERHRVGQPVYQQMLAAAASVGGVERAIVTTTDILPGADGAAWLAGVNITVVPA